MTWSRMLLIWCAMCGSLPAVAADREPIDLTRIDRKLLKEPEYSTTPRYCLLVFGRTAATQVWLVSDGKVLYVDRDRDGDLTEPNEVVEAIGVNSQSFRLGTITSAGGTNYRNVFVNRSSVGDSISVEIPGKEIQRVAPGQGSKLEFAGSAKEAPIIHFDGPLKLIQYSDDRVISRNSKAGNDRARALRIMIGTPGLGRGTFAAYSCKLCDKRGPLNSKFVYASASGDSEIELTEPLLKIG